MIRGSLKPFGRHVPPALRGYLHALRRLSRREAEQPYAFVRTEWSECDEVAEARSHRIRNILNYAKSSGSSYSASEFPAGYHTIRINGEVLPGQRQPEARLKKIPLDFTGLTLLDIGCNQGGMIFPIHEQLKWAVGIDCDPRMINACNILKNEFSVGNTYFYNFDVDRDPHDLLRDLLPEPSVDVVFLLSVCRWIKRWRELIAFCATISPTLILETNGSPEEQKEQAAELPRRFKTVELLAERSEDDPKWQERRFLLATNA